MVVEVAVGAVVVEEQVAVVVVVEGRTYPWVILRSFLHCHSLSWSTPFLITECVTGTFRNNKDETILEFLTNGEGDYAATVS